MTNLYRDISDFSVSQAPPLPEHICRDGYADWGTVEDCLTCGPDRERL